MDTISELVVAWQKAKKESEAAWIASDAGNDIAEEKAEVAYQAWKKMKVAKWKASRIFLLRLLGKLWELRRGSYKSFESSFLDLKY